MYIINSVWTEVEVGRHIDGTRVESLAHRTHSKADNEAEMAASMLLAPATRAKSTKPLDLDMSSIWRDAHACHGAAAARRGRVVQRV